MTGQPYLIRLMGFGLRRPKNPVPGADVSGRIVAVGNGVTAFQPGDEVFGIARSTFAEYAVAPAAKLAHKPADVSYEEAAAAAISGITALQALTQVGHVEAGQRVLVIGASGGVGSYAVQLAVALGSDVTGVASRGKADLVRSLGAQHVLDYAADDYLDGCRQYDLIIDIGGLNPVRRLRRALTAKGTLVIVGGEGGGRFTGGIGRNLRAMALSLVVRQRLTAFISRERASDIERLAQHLASGDVTASIGRRYRLDQAPEAVRDLADGRALGKSVITVRDH
jgi:NADPH:quinone reductase-like Zn-dependent oxidoreductase